MTISDGATSVSAELLYYEGDYDRGGNILITC